MSECPKLEMHMPAELTPQAVEAWRGLRSAEDKLQEAILEQQPYSKYDGKWAKRCVVC